MDSETGLASLEAMPISSPLLIEQTARLLRELIVDGRLAPGERLSERELGSRFGISRTPLREALRLLASERLVDLAPRRGARVALLDRDTIEDVFPVLKCLERLAVDLACRNLDDARIEALSQLVDKLAAAVRKRDKRRFFGLSEEFYGAIFQAAGNRTLSASHAQLSAQVRRARFSSMQGEAEWGEALREHQRLLRALKSRNGAAAVSAVSRRLDARRRKVLKELEAAG